MVARLAFCNPPDPPYFLRLATAASRPSQILKNKGGGERGVSLRSEGLRRTLRPAHPPTGAPSDRRTLRPAHHPAGACLAGARGRSPPPLSRICAKRREATSSKFWIRGAGGVTKRQPSPFPFYTPFPFTRFASSSRFSAARRRLSVISRLMYFSETRLAIGAAHVPP